MKYNTPVDAAALPPTGGTELNHRTRVSSEAEDRHFCRVFQGKEQPRLTFDDGVDVMKMLMTAYQSAEQGKTLSFPPKGIDQFVPAVAKGEWKGGLGSG